MMNAKNFSGQVMAENLIRKLWLVLSYEDPRDFILVKQEFFVNILIRRRYLGNRDEGLINIWLVFRFLTEFWLNYS